MKILKKNINLSFSIILIWVIISSFKLGEFGLSITKGSIYHLGKIEKIYLIDITKRDTLNLYYGKDYACRYDIVDSCISFSINNNKILKKISKIRLSEIDVFIDNVKHIARPQSFYAENTPLSEYFFMTANSLDYLVFFEKQVFYLDKRESFFKKSFVDRVIIPLSQVHK